MNKRTVLTAFILIATVISGCAGLNERPGLSDWNGVITGKGPRSGGMDGNSYGSHSSAAPLKVNVSQSSSYGLDNQSVVTDSHDKKIRQFGDGKFVNKQAQSHVDARLEEGEIKLNFQNANLLEVIQAILGDMLKMNYVVDPQVQGSVSMQTSGALSKDDVFPTLELILRTNNAALIEDQGLYRIVPLKKAVMGVRSPQLGDSSLPLPKGYSIQVTPLRYVAANEMSKILEPMMGGEKNLLRVDTRRNLLILAGNSNDMARYMETVRMFDVDYLAGASFALFTPDFVSAKTLGEELEKLLNDEKEGLLPGMIRFLVIERLNAILAVTPRPEYLKQVEQWVKRLDRDTENAGNRLFIYRVQNGKAKEIAEMLSKLFEKKDKGVGVNNSTVKPSLAPGLTPVKLSSQGGGEPTTSEIPSPSVSSSQDGLLLEPTSKIRIIADEANNALMIYASSQLYRQIKGALKQLDIVPLQVLIEVMIVEVTLNERLQYGVEWFFNNKGVKLFNTRMDGTGTLDLGAAGLSALSPAFSYALRGPGDLIRGVLNMLATESDLSILSSPSLMVLNNQEAEIQVGQEVPVSTQQQQSTTANSNIINSVEYKETGVKLSVKPRVNAGGLVIMDVEQEVSNIPEQNNSDPLTPRIQKRAVKSMVAVQSDDTVILGGLIRGSKDYSRSGLPGLHKIPVVGNLFSSTTDSEVRSELLVLITPRVIRNRHEALAITEEFRRQLHTLRPE